MYDNNNDNGERLIEFGAILCDFGPDLARCGVFGGLCGLVSERGVKNCHTIFSFLYVGGLRGAIEVATMAGKTGPRFREVLSELNPKLSKGALLTVDLTFKPGRPTTAPSSASNQLDLKSADEITEHLRNRILKREIPAGEWLREKKLSDEYDVGRSIVRRVLRALTEDGLVKLEENRGACVAAASPQDVFDLYEVRAALYGLATRFTCQRASGEQINQIVKMIDALLVDSESGVQTREIIEDSEAIFTLMASMSSIDTQKMIEQVRRKTRWQYSWIALEKMINPPGPYHFWRIVREGLLNREVDKASNAARDIILYMQSEVSQRMLSQGMGFVKP